MTVNDLSATLEIHGGYQGGTEPWQKSASLRADPDGFYDTHFVGGSGESPAPLELADIAQSLLSEFDRDALVKVLDRFATLAAFLHRRNTGALVTVGDSIALPSTASAVD